MEISNVHSSHVMKEIEISDPHSGMMCEICLYMTCVWCKFSANMDDKELSEPCIGESQYEEYERDRIWEISEIKFDY